MEKSTIFPEDKGIIDPILDIGFKLTFGREKVSECLLIDFLNSIFEGDSAFGNIVSVKYLNTEYPDEIEDGKTIRYDIMCSTSNNHRFIVEMQKAGQKHFLERSHYYVDRAVVRQGYRGKNKEGKVWDYSFEPVVGVFVCNFHINEMPRIPVVKGRYCIEETGEPMGNQTRLVFIQLPFFNKRKRECVNQLERWMYNIKNMGIMQSVAFKEYNEIFQYLESVSNVAALSEPDRERYESQLKLVRDYNAQMEWAKEKAQEEGWEKGMEKGRAEEKKEVAYNLFKQGVSLEVISSAVNLTIRKVKEILGIE